MESCLALPIKAYRQAKILHITDTHLFADKQATLLGVNTHASFMAVMNEIEKVVDQYDLIVASGDFVQDGSEQAYHHFASLMSTFNTPCVWLSGNHDVPQYIHSVFAHYALPADKVILLGKKWQVILLNSQVVGNAFGQLDTSQLALLENSLAHYPDRFALIFVHHHPIASGCEWLDQHGLKNSEALAQILNRYPRQVKALGWGHIHQQIDSQWQDFQVFATPSTCVQFKPHCNAFALEQIAPGWRTIVLSDNGTLETAVQHLKNNYFLPDMSQNGY